MELIRPVALFLLLFCGVAVGAEAERRQAEPCANGNTHQAGFCPAALSSASCSATGATTGSCSATSDESDGTRYVCATSNTTALTGSEIEACSGGAAVAGASAAETGSNSVSLSGLTTDAAHYGQIVNKSPEQWYSNRLVSGVFTPPSASTPYDLSAYSFHFTHTWPTAPTTTSTANASVGDTSALSTNGAEITFAAGNYGGVTASADDQHWILEDGANLQNLSISNSVNRLRVECRNARACDTGWITMNTQNTDILIYRVTATYTGNFGHVPSGQRIAIVESELLAGSYGLFGAADASPYLMDDITIAGNYIRITGTQNSHLTRWYSVDRFTFVDNYVVDESGGGDHMGFRHHADGNACDLGGVTTDDGALVSGNTFIFEAGSFGHILRPGTSSSAEPGCTVDEFRFTANTTYVPGSGGPVQWGDAGATYDLNHHFTNNVFYGGGQSTPSIPGGSTGTWTVSGNSYNSYQAPPAFSNW